MNTMHGPNWSKLLLLLVFIGLFTIGCTTPKGNPEEGKRWYMMNRCYACHGLNGDDGKGPMIRGVGLGYRYFHSTVRNANSQIMRPFPESKLSDQDIADIYAWLEAK